MYFGSGPNCAKIWEYLSKVEKDYAESIDSICAKDILSDNLGITVIIPDKDFINDFKTNGNASTARRMLMNTVIKRFLPTAAEFNTDDFKRNLPIRSGLGIRVESISGNDVKLSNGITISPTDFKTPDTFRYAVWRVTSGKYPSDTNFNIDVNKRGRKTTKKLTTAVGGFIEGMDDDSGNETERSTLGYSGGGSRNQKDTFNIQMGRLIKNSPDTVRVSIMASILTEYKIELIRDRCANRNPLLVKAASLYNWLSMYYPKVLNAVLPITDIHPGVNLMLLILDPGSPVTVEMLMGNKNVNDAVYISQGWRGVDITENAYGDWNKYLTNAAGMLTNNNEALTQLLTFRKNIVSSTGLDYAASVALVSNLYKDFMNSGNIAGNRVFPTETVSLMYTGEKNKDRKLWQDQLRFVATCAFSGSCEANILNGTDVDEELAQAVRFRPVQGYTSSCTLTTVNGNFMAKDEYYAFLKWLFSTDFMYFPQQLSSDLCTSTAAPYNGLEYGKVARNAILNNHFIKAEMVNSMRGLIVPSAFVTYAKEWASKSAQPMVGGIDYNNPKDRNLGVYASTTGYTTNNASIDVMYGDNTAQYSEPQQYGQTYFKDKDTVPYDRMTVGGIALPPREEAFTSGFNNVMVSDE